VNIIIPTPRVIETISDHSVQSYPKRLPMIVPPKLYTNMTNGGYLLNDEMTTDTIITRK